MITFQELIRRLTDFWEKQGCIIHQGHDLEVGAGTFNPATFLRCLGPEPYTTAYVEPSRRPADGRFGENPNRVHLFHQYQVIMKPSPLNIQDLYIESLKAIGLDLKRHDIRFVHDDWESPTLGAWGLGWEVWIDGMEVSQFTYFQAIGSLPLNPISAEITYGLERLAMFIQNVDNIFSIKWNKELTLRDISHRSEIEWSFYNFQEASTAMWLRHFDDYESEAKILIARHFPIPAYDFVLKASHAFNVLDARGAISVTERTGYIGRIRDLARLIALEYLNSREKQGFPLAEKRKKKLLKALPKIPTTFNAKKKADFLLEIGSEQLPATFVPIGCANLEKSILNLFQKLELDHEGIKVFGTPRRLAVLVKNLAEGTTSKKIERRGPAIRASFDEKGDPTAQGLGFLKSIGHSKINLEQIRQGKINGLEIRILKEEEYLFVSLFQSSKSTLSLLAQELPNLILSLDFPKKMRWSDLDISYPRPLRWINALFGTKVIPFYVGNIASSRESYGHAQLNPKKFLLKHPKDYLSTLRKHFVLADIEERKTKILKQLKTLESKLRGIALQSSKVLEQVLYLTEWPLLASATFDEEFLKAPKEVLICEMVEHQKYFPIATKTGQLKNVFIITADNIPTQLIRKGNQKVLSARLSDGVFLYEQDLSNPLENFNQQLEIMTFQKDLGSMYDKVMRLISHAEVLNRHLSLADDTKIMRAALLSKADLASTLVGEFPELQGILGKYYALAQKEDKEVAQAIEEQWMPRGDQAPLPKTPSGIILSLADKIDNLLGYYSVGLKPSSSSDPYALRRQAIGFLKILIEEERSINLKTILETCAQGFPRLKGNPKAIVPLVEEVLNFMTSRAKSVFEEQEFQKDEIEASLQGLCIDPYDQFCKIKALHQFRKSGNQFVKLVEVYKRAKGQLEKRSETIFNPSLADEPAEKELIKQLDLLSKHWKATLKERNYFEAFRLMSGLQPHLANLFDHVKILADDPRLRENRIALLQKVFSHFEMLLDFSKIQ